MTATSEHHARVMREGFRAAERLELCSCSTPNQAILTTSIVAGGTIGLGTGGPAGVIPGLFIGGLSGVVLVLMKESVQNHCNSKK